MSLFSAKKFKQPSPGDFHKDPFFYFGVISFVLLGVLFFGSNSLAQLDSAGFVAPNAISSNTATDTGDLYLAQNSAKTLENPDFKTSQDAFLYGVSTPHVVTTQTLGAMMGGSVDQPQNRTEVIDYTVQPGDTVQSIAANFGLSATTVMWANGLSKNATLKTGQSLIILPIDGVLHVVKSGDTVGAIAKTYKASAEDIISFDNLSGDADVFEGDILVVPGGSVAPKASIATSIGSQNILPDSWGIFPLLRFKVTQGLHPTNAIDISSLDGLGSPVYAVAKGVVQRAGYDRVGGNRITILHENGVVTYYGHLGSMLVVPGTTVTTGQQIGTEGKTGEATGPHVHFQVIGAANFLAKYPVGTIIDVTKK